MIKVREFDFEDVLTIELKPEDKTRLIYSSPTEWIEIAKRGIAYTLLYDNGILCCGGVLLYRKGFGEAWILCSRQVDEHPIITIRAVKRIMEGIIRKYNMYRLQATVRCDWQQAQGFIEFLGFQKEGRLRKYGPDESDYYMYSRIT